MANKHVGVLDCTRRGAQIEKHGAFTQTHDGYLNSMAFVTQGDRSAILRSARWDTGSNYTYIDCSSALALDPDDDDPDFVQGAAGELHESKRYTVELQLPGGIRIANVEIGDLDLSSLRECDAIIGMDIIRKGRLVVTEKDFSFEV